MTKRDASDIDAAVEAVGELACAVLHNSGALACCPHDGTVIRVGDEDAERQAFESGKATLRDLCALELEDALSAAIQRELDMAAVGECPECAILTPLHEVLH